MNSNGNDDSLAQNDQVSTDVNNEDGPILDVAIADPGEEPVFR